MLDYNVDKHYNVRVWYFARGKNIPLMKTDIKRVNGRELLEYLNSNLIEIRNNGDYFVIKKYANYSILEDF